MKEPSIEEMRQRIKNISLKYPWLVSFLPEGIIGYAYASKHRERAAYQWDVEVSVYISKRYQGCGIGSSLYDVLFKILKDLGYYNAYAGITLPNPASVALHEKMGFTKIGVFKEVGYKLAAWHDVGWWQLFLQKKEAEPKNPIEFQSWEKEREKSDFERYGIAYGTYRNTPNS